MNGLSANKKIIISVVAFVAVMGIIVGALIFMSREKEPENPTEQEHEQVQSNLFVEDTDYYNEGTTSAEVTMSPAMNFNIDADEGAIIEAFISGNYYISMVDYSSGNAAEMQLAIRGYDIQMAMDMNGMKMDIMILNDNIYLVNSKEKKYIDFNSLMTMMGESTDSIDFTEMREIADMLNVSEYQFQGVEHTDTYLNGSAASYYRCYTNEFELCFWFVSGELRQVDFASVGGEDKTSIEIKEFSPTIPSGMLTLIGLQRSNLFDFFGEDFMQAMQ